MSRLLAVLFVTDAKPRMFPFIDHEDVKGWYLNPTARVITVFASPGFPEICIPLDNVLWYGEQAS